MPQTLPIPARHAPIAALPGKPQAGEAAKPSEFAGTLARVLRQATHDNGQAPAPDAHNDDANQVANDDTAATAAQRPRANPPDEAKEPNNLPTAQTRQREAADVDRPIDAPPGLAPDSPGADNTNGLDAQALNARAASAAAAGSPTAPAVGELAPIHAAPNSAAHALRPAGAATALPIEPPGLAGRIATSPGQAGRYRLATDDASRDASSESTDDGSTTSATLQAALDAPAQGRARPPLARAPHGRLAMHPIGAAAEAAQSAPGASAGAQDGTLGAPTHALQQALASAADLRMRAQSAETAGSTGTASSIAAHAAPLGSALSPALLPSAGHHAQSVPSATLSSALHSREFAPAFGAQVALWVRDGVHEARLQLHPAELGPISVQIALDGAAAHIDFHAQHALTRQAIEASLPALASALREAGLTLAGGGVFDQAAGQPGAQTPQAREGAQRQSGAEPLGQGEGSAMGRAPGQVQRGLLDVFA